MKPLVSILIPAHNAAPWLAETVRSALAQTWPRREIIIVDDGSSDGTVALARQFASKEVHVVSQEHLGVSAARNRAYSLCQGDYIQWLDADDLLGTKKIEQQLAVAERLASPRALLSCSWAYFFWRTEKARFKPTPLWADLSSTEWLRQKMAGGHHMQTATWLISRELCGQAGPWNTELVRDNDGEYLARVLMAGESVAFVPEAKVYYRVSGTGQITYPGLNDAKMESLWKSMQLHVQYLLSLENSPATHAACLSYLQIWSNYFYPSRPDLLRRAEQLAVELGGRLAPPKLSWKYNWLQKLAGWKTARGFQTTYNQKKLSVLRAWDHGMYRLQNSKNAL